MGKISWRLGALSVGLALLAACDRDTPVAPEVADAPANAEAASSLSPAPVELPQEAEFHRLGREIEGYGGHYFDEQGNLVLHLVDPAEESRARQLLAPVLNSRTLDGQESGQASEGSVTVRHADFTFQQLAGWRDQATSEVLLEEGVEFLDLDEVQNRVVIGVSSLRGRMVAARTLQQRGIPAEAILFVETQPAEKLQSLTQRFRPLRGGYRIGNDISQTCTLGVNVRYGGKNGFLTASHCTPGLLHPDGVGFHQPSALQNPLLPPVNYVGREISDPNVNPRFSAVALVETGAYHDLGMIARTTYSASGSGASGSTTIDLANPRFWIDSEFSGMQLNQPLHKIGQATGWTIGVVRRTCVHYNVAGKVLFCQDLIRNMHATPGDSGAPVFGWSPANPTSVRLAGILWGRVQEGGVYHAAMSRMTGIRQDHNSSPMLTFWPPVP